MTFAERIAYYKKRRRKAVKRFGKRSFRRVNRFLATQSAIPDVPVFDRALFPFVAEFEAGWKEMRAELERILPHRDALPHLYEMSRDNKRISGDHNWKTFVLYGFGFRSEENCRRCPETAKLLAKVPRLETAFFSILAPGAHVPEHQGIAKGLVRVHIPLMVPRAREKCVIFIDHVPHPWEEGRALVFDDTFDHEVRNDTDESRVVLLFDFERPMRPLGRLVNRLLLAAMRRTGYVQDAKKAHQRWEQLFERHLQDAEPGEDDGDDEAPAARAERT